MDKLLGLTLDNDDNKKEIVAWTSTDREATCRHGFIGPVVPLTLLLTLTRQYHS